MNKNKKVPVENQQTAAWANIEKLKGKGKIPIPSKFDVDNAKDWVETNEK